MGSSEKINGMGHLTDTDFAYIEAAVGTYLGIHYMSSFVISMYTSSYSKKG